MPNGWNGTQFWFSVLIVLLSFVALVIHHVNGAQFMGIVMTASGLFGARKVVEHRNDNSTKTKENT